MTYPITWTIPATLAQTEGLKPQAQDHPNQPNQPNQGGGQNAANGSNAANNAQNNAGQSGAGGANQTPQQNANQGANQGSAQSLKQPANAKGEGANPKANDSWWGGGGTMLILLLFFVVLWIFLMGGQRKEKKKRAEMLSSLEKGSRIQTVGGVLGTIVELRDDEVIVKVDENTNARMRFARSSIQSVRDEEGAEDQESKN